MPTAKEQIANKGLSGVEFKKILLKRVENMLDRDAIFSDRLLYEQVAFRFKLQIFTGNPNYPEHANNVESTDLARNEPPTDANGRGKVVAPKTIKGGSGGAKILTSAKQHDGVIDSPNLARIDNELPLIMQRKNLETGLMEDVEVPFEGEGTGKDYPELNVQSTKDIGAGDEEWK